MNNDSLFQVTALFDDIYLIRDYVGVASFLIIGQQKAALIDTGIGIGNILDICSALTEKEIDVYLTHGHVDHVGGISLFKNIYVKNEDYNLALEQSKKEYRIAFASAFHPEIKDLNLFMPEYGGYSLHNMPDVIELGDRKLRAIPLSGHTKGSVGFYDEKTSSIFLGDAMNNSTFLFLEESSTIHDYLNVLINFKETWLNKVDHLFISHEYIDVPKRVVDDLIDASNLVINGRGCKKEFIIPFVPLQNSHSFWAFEGEAKREDGFGNLIYDERKI